MMKTNLKNETVRDYLAKTQSLETTHYGTDTNNCVVINSFPVYVKEYNDRRVVTFKDIDTIHGRPNGTSRKRFNDNKSKFVENEDYYVVNQPSEIRTLGITRPQGGTPEFVTFITESGYLMLVKSFTDDLAWKVQRELVSTYFRAKDMFTAIQTFSQSLLNEMAILKDKVSDMEYTLKTKKPFQPNFWLWKKRIVRPAIDNLVKLLNIDTRTAYDMVYDHMGTTYGFDKSFAMSQFCTKYQLDSNTDSVSTIDAIADSPEYQREFVEVVNKMISVSGTVVSENATIPVVGNVNTDKVQEAILPLIHKYNDTSINGALTYRRVYNAMNKSNRTWENVKTRYHCKSKKDVLIKCERYYKEFVKAVNQLLSENEVATP